MKPSRFKVNPTVSSREVADELVILELMTGEFFVCRGTGPRVWELLGQGSTITEIAEIVACRYGVDRQKVTVDVEDFVTFAVEKGLLVEDG